MRLEALKSIEMALDGENVNQKENLKRKKSKLKKRKKRKKQAKVISSSSSSSPRKRRCSRDPIKVHRPSLLRQSDNYEIQDMEIDTTEAILADKDMRYLSMNSQAKQQMLIDEPKTISLMDLMIDNEINQFSKQPQFNSNGLFLPKQFFEYQIPPQQNFTDIPKNQQIINKPTRYNEIQTDENDDGINELRDKLLNELNQKRAQKQQQQVIEEAKCDGEFDLSNYETTIQLARKQIEEATTVLQQQQQTSTSVITIKPVIIKLGQNETSSSEEEEEELEKIQKSFEEKTLQSNINLFLNAAKEQAKLEIQQKQQQITTEDILKVSQSNRIVIKNSSNSPVNSSSPSKFSATIKRLKETSKKDEIRIIRDKINSKSKEIAECNKKSVEIKQMLFKKTKVINLSKEKLKLLKEQLQAAEKILQANEETVKDYKLRQKVYDMKIVRLKEMKKKQQEHLQHLLVGNNEATAQASNVVQKNVRTVIISSPKPQQPVIEASNKVPVEIQTKPIETKPIENIQQQIQEKENTAKMNLVNLELMLVKKSPIINNELKERIDNLKLKSLNKESKSSQNKAPTTTNTNANNSLRPKIFVSKQTNQKLLQIAIDKFESNVTLNNKLSQPMAPIVKMEKAEVKIENQKIQNTIIKNLTDIVDNFTKNSAYVHFSPSLITIKDMIVNKESKSYFCNLNDIVMDDLNCETAIGSEEYPVKINTTTYESPLLMFKGYRFNKNFYELNNFEMAYSKFYCNSIDIRKPFCPFDLNGSCKDSTCIYQHSSVMTMDNLQRTEHFLSYCPQLINVTEGLSQKEAIKRLSKP